MSVMRVPFFSFERIVHQSGVAVAAAIRRVTDSSLFILGPEVRAFEEEWAEYCGAEFCVGTASGLAALQLSLKGSGVRPGDEVVVPEQTFIATWLAASEIGASPMPAAVQPADCLVSAASIASAVSVQTKAVVPVHLFGRRTRPLLTARMEGSREIAVIEDAAQAHGVAHYRDSSQPSPLAIAFSFYPTKNLGAMGDAGSVVTRDAALAEEIRLLSNYGSREKYVHTTQGSNLRLDEIQAAILRARLPFLDEWNSTRRSAARAYLQGLQGLPIQLPPSQGIEESAWHLFTIRVKERDELRSWMSEKGVETGIHYPRAPADQPAFEHVSSPGEEGRAWASEALSLPLWPGMSRKAQCQVVEAIASFYEKRQVNAEPGS